MILNVCSPNFDPCDSYGRLASELAANLAGHTINRITLHPEGLPRIVPMLGGLVLGYPTLHKAYGYMVNAGPKVAITMFESTRIPAEWAEPLNQCTAVIVPSSWLVDVFRGCGVTAPLHVVPLGVSRAFYGASRRTVRPFTFLAIADRGRRKGWHQAIMGFQQAFGDDPHYKLILKARHLPLKVTNSNIEILDGDMTDDELAALYRRCHVMVFASSGEGFGLPPREFAATGGVVLATNWGGTADDLDQWGVPLPYTLNDAWEDKPEWHGVMGQWADVDTGALTDLMKHVAQHYSVYQDQAIWASGFVQSHYRWSAFARQVLTIYQQYAGVKDDARDGRRTQLLPA